MSTYSVPILRALCILLTHLIFTTTSKAILRKTSRNLKAVRVMLKEIPEQMGKTALSYHGV